MNLTFKSVSDQSDTFIKASRVAGNGKPARHAYACLLSNRCFSETASRMLKCITTIHAKERRG